MLRNLSYGPACLSYRLRRLLSSTGASSRDFRYAVKYYFYASSESTTSVEARIETQSASTTQALNKFFQDTQNAIDHFAKDATEDELNSIPTKEQLEKLPQDVKVAITDFSNVISEANFNVTKANSLFI